MYYSFRHVASSNFAEGVVSTRLMSLGFCRVENRGQVKSGTFDIFAYRKIQQAQCRDV